MRFVHRQIEREILRAARAFPAIVMTGPRRAGKTTLLRKLLPGASYFLFEDPDVIARVRTDPQGFMAEVRAPAIFDEIQAVPEILRYVRSRIDSAPRRAGQWFLTGSQDAPLMRGVTESLAGRAAVFQLLPLSTRESAKVSILRGGFPEVLARPATSGIWFRSFVQTYLERDVRTATAIRDLSTFRRFLSLLAARCGQLLNKTEIAAPLGVSVPTLTQWLSVLEVTAQIVLVPPFYENFGKRITKSPKLYFGDSGLACHLLGIDSARALARSPFRGSIFEGFVATEIIKQQLGGGHAKELYFFRDQQGLEVDFIVPAGERKLRLVEAKAAATARPEMADSLARLAHAITRYETEALLVYEPAGAPARKRVRAPRSQARAGEMTALRPGVRAVGLEALLDRLAE